LPPFGERAVREIQPHIWLCFLRLSLLRVSQPADAYWRERYLDANLSIAAIYHASIGCIRYQEAVAAKHVH
jgi:hypothetical protein